MLLIYYNDALKVNVFDRTTQHTNLAADASKRDFIIWAGGVR
jgi:hypothetical protein